MNELQPCERTKELRNEPPFSQFLLFEDAIPVYVTFYNI